MVGMAVSTSPLPVNCPTMPLLRALLREKLQATGLIACFPVTLGTALECVQHELAHGVNRRRLIPASELLVAEATLQAALCAGCPDTYSI